MKTKKQTALKINLFSTDIYPRSDLTIFHLTLAGYYSFLKIKSINKTNNFFQYFRDVIASELLLNMPERIDWRECVQPQDEEKQMSVDFRNSFKSFDPFN